MEVVAERDTVAKRESETRQRETRGRLRQREIERDRGKSRESRGKSRDEVERYDRSANEQWQWTSSEGQTEG
ncbi:hypothetical protein L6452_17539 [Arctium lappa]|uniref:Uncharacterized protein n=1 Tax=Arctium lappa TaxID=4217 RepID=A0ACB9C3N3_ARCLA|nr:hypothetical protein L6452_17539 [Arctium lappa]